MFPHSLDGVYEFLLQTISNNPRFLVNTIRMLDALAKFGANALVLEILRRFERVLTDLAPRKLESFLMLAERIVVEDQINPTVCPPITYAP